MFSKISLCELLLGGKQSFLLGLPFRRPALGCVREWPLPKNGPGTPLTPGTTLVGKCKKTTAESPVR